MSRLGESLAWWWNGQRAGRTTLVGVVIGAVVLVGLGAGYKATRALTDDGSAWLRKGDTVVQVNGPSGRFDAVVADKPVSLAAAVSDPLDVVQEPDGQVFTADPSSHQVYQVDLSDMTPQAGPRGTAVLAQGAAAYVVDSAAGTVTPIDSQTMAPGRPVRVPGRISGQAIGPDGTVYIGQADGRVTTISAGRSHAAHTVQVGAGGATMLMTVAGSTPVAVDVSSGQLFPLSTSGQPTLAVSLPAGGSGIEVGQIQPAGQVYLVRGSTLIGFDLSDDVPHIAPLTGGHAYGAPVVQGDRVYVPDETAGQVLVFSTGDLSTQPAVAVPPGADGDYQIEVVARDGNVFIDNPSSEDATEIGADGQTQTIDKGTGNDVVKPAPSSTTPPKSATPPPASPPAATPGPAVTSPATVEPSAGPVTPSVQAPAGGTPLGSSKVPAEVPVGGDTGPGSTPSGTDTTATAPTPPTTVTVTVPAPDAGEQPSAYCARVDTLGLTCTAQDQGRAPAGSPDDVVYQTDPPAGAQVPQGQSVTADYYSSTTPTGPVPAVTGQDYADACTSLSSASATVSFACTETDLGPAPAGTPAGLVVSQDPAAGQTEPTGTSVTLSVHEDGTVPDVPSGSDYSDYCTNQLQPVGFKCSEVAETGAPPAGAVPNAVVSTNPAAGSSAPAGSTIEIDYYPTYDVTVPSCVGAAVSSGVAQCTPVDGVTYQTVSKQSATPERCDVVLSQSATTVAYGSTVTVTYDPDCPVPLYEINYGSSGVHYLTPTEAYPYEPFGNKYSWSSTWSASAQVYPLVNGGCGASGGKPGTVALTMYLYSESSPKSGGIVHYYFSIDGSLGSYWSNAGTVACVYRSNPGQYGVQVYKYEDNAGPPQDWSWHLRSYAGETPAWWQVQVP